MAMPKAIRQREHGRSTAVLERGTAMCNHLQAALFHLAHGHDDLAISEVRKSCTAYERLCTYYPNVVLPRELHRAFHASLDWTIRPYGLASLALATCALVEWRVTAFRIDMAGGMTHVTA